MNILAVLMVVVHVVAGGILNIVLDVGQTVVDVIEDVEELVGGVKLFPIRSGCETNCPQDIHVRNHVCVGESSFKLCKTSGGKPVDTIFSCPQGTVCTYDPSRCVRFGTPVCESGCGVCDPITGITCLSRTIFAYCVDGKPSPKISAKCSLNQVCVSENMAICLTLKDQVTASCNQETPYKIPTNDTENPPGDPLIFCRNKNAPGRYPAGDIQCQKYYYCYPLHGQIQGKMYSCPGSTVFDCRKSTCGNECINDCR